MTSLNRLLHALGDLPLPAHCAVFIGSWVLSMLQPAALLVTISWGGLQIYLAVEKRWFKEKK